MQLSSIVLPVEALHCCDTNCSKHNQSLQAYHDAIISCCITSGTESIPLKGGSKSSKSGPGRVPGWTKHVEQSKQRAIFWHWLWKVNGLPRHGHVAQIRRATRTKYHYAVRKVKRDQERIVAMSKLIPIPKNKKKSLNDSSNYRAISMSNILGKFIT